MIRRLALTGALVVAVFATTFSSAHAATVTPSKWASKFCTALEDWQSSIKDKGDDVETALGNASDLTAARGKLVKYLDEMETDTQDAINSLKKAGNPSSPNGAKIAALFVKGLSTARDDFTVAKTAAGKLSTSDPAAFTTEGTKIGTDLQHAGAELADSFTGVDKLDKGGVLGKAIQGSKACAFLTGSSK